MSASAKLLRWCGLLLVAVVALRLLTLGLYPLTDTTEARYAEMARKMIATGNWLTPMFDVDVPFWGKPPLSFWLSAVPMALFGASEFSSRLGPLMAAGLTMLLFWHWPRDGGAVTGVSDENAINSRAINPLAIWASLVFSSTPLGFVASGAVMTDMAMVAGTSLSMVAFWRVVSAPGKHGAWPWLFFLGQAIGLMAKGPVAMVLSGLAIGGWVLWHGRSLNAWQVTWQRLPWVRGVLLLLLLVLPWYLLAERATPGFLRYFIVGEHWYRFTQSGWKGDLYGVAHAQPKGRIWLFALVSTLPWVLAACWWAVRGGVGARQQGVKVTSGPATSSAFSRPGEWAYLMCWALAPCVFFTMSGNILPAYVLPGLPALALLVATLAVARAAQGLGAGPMRLVAGVCALLTPVAFTVLVLMAPQRFDVFSDKALLQGAAPDQVVYLLSRPDSGVFYTAGQARLVTTPQAIRATLDDLAPHRVVLPVNALADWQAELQAQGWAERGRNKLGVAFERPGGRAFAAPLSTPVPAPETMTRSRP